MSLYTIHAIRRTQKNIDYAWFSLVPHNNNKSTGITSGLLYIHFTSNSLIFRIASGSLCLSEDYTIHLVKTNKAVYYRLFPRSNTSTNNISLFLNIACIYSYYTVMLSHSRTIHYISISMEIEL